METDFKNLDPTTSLETINGFWVKEERRMKFFIELIFFPLLFNNAQVWLVLFR